MRGVVRHMACGSLVRDRKTFSILMLAGGGFKVREQRDEHQAVQLLAAPVLVAQFHGCFHMVPAVCR